MRNPRNSFDKRSLDSRFDQILETGRQFVDGVSGARPGKRKSVSLSDISRKNARNVGQWVNNKIDSFFEEEEFEDDWENDIFDNDGDTKFKSFSRQEEKFNDSSSVAKRPLESISLREQVYLPEQRKLVQSQDLNDNWPLESDFKIDKWQRNNNSSVAESIKKDNIESRFTSNKRNLPRSRRRRS